MQSLDDEDENEYKDVLMNNFGADSESENESDEEEGCLRLHRDFMTVPKSKNNRPPPIQLLHDQKINATSLIWNKLLRNSSKLLKNKTAFELFTTIWTKDVVIYIADETNIFAKQMIIKYQNDGLYDTSKLTQWVPTNPNEIYAYLGILIAMSQCMKPKFKDYFDPTIKITQTPNYNKYITKDRFWLLYNLVHIVDNTWFDQALTDPKSDLLQLKHFMHHYCLKNNDNVKVWHRKKFLKLLNYCIVKIEDLVQNKWNIGRNVYDKLFELYKTRDYSMEYVDFSIRGVTFCGSKDFREKVCGHLPQKFILRKGECAVCEKKTLYSCASCKAYLCIKDCYQIFPHSGKQTLKKNQCVNVGKEDESVSSVNVSKRGRIIKKLRHYDDIVNDPTFSLTKKKVKGNLKVVASKKKP